MCIKTNLWKHANFCKERLRIAGKIQRGEAVKNGLLLLPIRVAKSQFYAKIIANVRDDIVRLIILTDPLILSFGQRQFKKYGHESHQQYYLSQKVRELGRLLECVKIIDPNISMLEECLHPNNWEVVLQAVKKVAGHKDTSNKYKTPSLPLKLGHSLIKCAKMLKAEGIIEGNSEKRKVAEDFALLYQIEWNERISGQALATLDTNSYNKPKLLPLVEDVAKLHSYLSVQANSLTKVIQSDPKCYSDLAEVCLAKIILFNRKGSGEVERMKVSEFTDSLKAPEEADPDVKLALTAFEQRGTSEKGRLY